jgi:hypothetical protein
MLLFEILIQIIYRAPVWGAGVGTTPPNRGCSAGSPYTEVSASLPVTIWEHR